jgi:hypothetical protein
MQLQLVRHLWGVTAPIAEAFPKFKEEGYTAIECPLRDDAEFATLLKQHGFDYVAMAFTGGASVADHVKSFREQLEKAQKMGAKQLTVHSGSDAWSMSECEAFYKEIVAIEKDASIQVGHETHRGRAFYSPWITRDVLQKFPTLKLCVDFSHWVCVAERLEWDDAQGSIVKLCADRALHTHTRVGYEEGPQVPDPAAPEYKNHVDTHLDWWMTIFKSQKARGLKTATVTPEFGPPGYMHTLPHTNVPVADLWKVCNWIAGRVKDRFAEI